MVLSKYCGYVELLLTRVLLDYADDDDKEEGGEEDDLVLSYWEEDGYPLLPAINSNIPLDQLKHLLRIYA